MKRYLYSTIIFFIAAVSLAGGWYETLSLALSAILLVMLLDKIGKGIVLRETIAFLYAFTCLVMPVIGYKYYDPTNGLAKLWVRYMPVPENNYFSYALPAVAFFAFAITLPFRVDNYTDDGNEVKVLIDRIKKILTRTPKIGLVIISIGLIVSLGIKFIPGGLQFFATLFFFSSFAGLLYIYYAPNFKYKYSLMVLFGLFIIYNAISVGMFTIVAYMGITIFSFLMLGKRTSLLRKITIFCVAAFFMIVLQNVKLAYRDYIWRSNYSDSKVALFADLFWKNIQKGDELIEQNAFFQIYTRGNQGFNVALVMRRIPAIKPYDNGNNITKAFASAFVPRFLWPDKPEAGGKFNMEYYTGWVINGWSTNVGPLGEAYGSFGVTGGIIYMFFLGLFIRWVYVRVFKSSIKIPLMVCWLPVFFFQIVSSAETDSLQIFNSLIKSAFFVWLIVKIFPLWFGIVRKQVLRPRVAASSPV
ncbi:MAG TPA: hypothetical protein VL307_06410 [Chitinophagaceae bacterium]|nr:hypothetical protein [Chitinophagaceae bacterium]